MRRMTALTGLVSLSLVLPGPARAASAPVSIEAVSVSPASPGAGVLCGLSVRLKNAGAHTATNFRFKVKIDGEDVIIYSVETFGVNVAPGTSDTITLHNFWTPIAPKAKLTVEVTVLEGQWADVKKDATSSTTTPIGPIEGLPITATQTVQTSAK